MEQVNTVVSDQFDHQGQDQYKVQGQMLSLCLND